MVEMIFELTGGIGLFLLGMILLSDGLKAFAGDSLRRTLIKFTGTPVKAFSSGALATVMLQSSTATTITVIGFVSAGMLTFPQAVGVVFGASLGTTGTGWIVAVLGLKISLGFYALPLIGIGAFLKLLAPARWRSLGLALAGFGLIFVGIETLQDGMHGMSGAFNLAKLPSGGLWGHLLAMLIGIALSVIMQSSSAAVATTLTALHTAAINFEQAAPLVIGAAIGTTVTSALVAMGANVSAKRTALAHILFNLATGLIAIVLLPLLLWGITQAQEHLHLSGGATSLAAFHTLFISLGVVIFLPIVHPFSRWIERLLPDKGPALARHLDDTLLNVPDVALEATRRALRETAREFFDAIRTSLETHGRVDGRFILVREALERIQVFFAKIPPVTDHASISELRITQMHAIDHLARLQNSLRLPAGVKKVLAHEHLRAAVLACRNVLDLGALGLSGRAGMEWEDNLEKKARELAELRRRERPEVLSQTASGEWGTVLALEVLDAMRWLDRVGYHVWRIGHYLGENGKPGREEKSDIPDPDDQTPSEK